MILCKMYKQRQVVSFPVVAGRNVSICTWQKIRRDNSNKNYRPRPALRMFRLCKVVMQVMEDFDRIHKNVLGMTRLSIE
jgi:hypothetical protein